MLDKLLLKEIDTMEECRWPLSGCLANMHYACVNDNKKLLKDLYYDAKQIVNDFERSICRIEDRLKELED